MPSKDFDQFYDSCFGDSFGIIHDGINQKAILNLRGDERRDAEKLLLRCLGTDEDTYNRPVIALGLLHSQEAVEPLHERLVTAFGVDRIEIAIALYRIEKYSEAEKIVVECVKEGGSDEAIRLLAAQVLPCFGKTRQVIQTLLDLLAEDNVIGYSAAVSLRTLFIDDELTRDLMGQLLLNPRDIHVPEFLSREKLVKQIAELILVE